jgi:hypothetical protein
MSIQRKVLFLSPRNSKLNLNRKNGQMLLDSWVKATRLGKMTRTNILRAQKWRGGSPTTELALHDPRNMARLNFVLLASLKITAGPTLKDLDPASIRINKFYLNHYFH